LQVIIAGHYRLELVILGKNYVVEKKYCRHATVFPQSQNSTKATIERQVEGLSQKLEDFEKQIL
jgi:hypothetical protein